MVPMPDELGLDLIDRARQADEPLLAPMLLDLAKLRLRARSGVLPSIFSGLVRAPSRAGSLKQRLSSAGDEDRRRLIVDETRAQIATALGYPSPDNLQMDLSFLELGIDSLVGLELRNRLQAVTGLSLPAKLVFDHPTPAALVDHLQGLLNGTGGERAAPMPKLDSEAAKGHPGAGSLSAMFRRAHQLGKIKDGIALAEAAARLRPKFGLSHTETQAPTVIPLAKGETDPILFCFPSLVAIAGPHEYARLAKSFENRRDIVAVPAPGFASEELLPSTIDAVVGAQAVAIQRYAESRKVAFVGYSTGGPLAYAVASECARQGMAPSAVVLIDSYTMDTMWRVTDPVFDRMLAGEGSHPAVSEDTLTAMGAYLGMLSRWTPDETVAPTLLVRASNPMPGIVQNGDWRATWTARHVSIEVPGSHLTIIEDHADSTARAIEEWLVRHPGSREKSKRFRRLGRSALARQ